MHFSNYLQIGIVSGDFAGLPFNRREVFATIGHH